MKLVSIIHVIVVVQSGLFALVLFSKIKDKPGNKYLAALLITIAVHFAYNFFFSNELASPMLIALSSVYGFLYGPLFYLYVKSSLWKDFKITAYTAMHFIPFLLIVFAVLLGDDMPMTVDLGLPILLSMAIYIALSFVTIHRYQLAAKHVLSSSTSLQVRWQRFFLYCMVIIVITNFIQSFYPIVSIGDLEIKSEVFVQLGILMLVNIIVVHGLRNPGFFIKLSIDDLSLQTQTTQKTNTSGYSPQALKEVAEKLNKYVNLNAPYTDADLTVNKLAEALDVHPRMLSQAINHELGTNFSDYINSLRIKLAKFRFENPKDEGETIVEVMYDVGFNSRSVFNTLFKEKTGFTPSHYKKEH